MQVQQAAPDTHEAYGRVRLRHLCRAQRSLRLGPAPRFCSHRLGKHRAAAHGRETVSGGNLRKPSSQGHAPTRVTVYLRAPCPPSFREPETERRKDTEERDAGPHALRQPHRGRRASEPHAKLETRGGLCGEVPERKANTTLRPRF